MPVPLPDLLALPAALPSGRRRRFLQSVALAAGGLAGPDAARADTADTAPWVAAWGAAVQDLMLSVPRLPGLPGPVVPELQGRTLRQRLVPAVDGAELRVRISNLFGQAPLSIAAASVAPSGTAEALGVRAPQPLRFGGQATLVLAPGAMAVSDALALPVQVGQALSVSLYLDRATPATTVHHLPTGASWSVPGNAVGAAQPAQAQPLAWNHFVNGLDVRRRSGTRVVVAFGDSITEGVSSAEDRGPRTYPEQLAQRLRTDGQAPASVLNAGIGGNRLLNTMTGPSGLSRFARDVLDASGVTHAILLIGINDIGVSAVARRLPGMPPGQIVSVQALAGGIAQLAAQARTRGVKVLVGTLLPFKGSGYWSEDAEAMRQALNRWIRGLQQVDGVIDFDAALRDAADPLMLNPAYDSGDHLHPNDAGNLAMATAVDLRELRE